MNEGHRQLNPRRSAWLASVCLVVGIAPSSTGASEKADIVLYRQPDRYAAFPTLLAGPADQLWVSFSWNTTRSHYGRAAGGQTGSESLYSLDGGETWSRRGADDGYRPPSPDLSAFRLSDGTLLRIGPRMHEVLPASRKAELVARGVAVKEWPDGHISASYRVVLNRHRPGDETSRSADVPLPPFASMGGFGTGAVLADDTVLKPVYGSHSTTDPATRTWALRSTDGGESWQLVDVAYDGLHSFNEAEFLELPDGRVLALIRAQGGKGAGPLYERGFLWQCHSDDGGKTWSPPARTDMWGYPPHLLLLKSGAVLCTYGYRRPPYGIRACFSRDNGETWDTGREAILRCDALPEGPGAGRGGIGDLGYPKTIELSDGTLVTAYYITLGDGVTHVAATRWSSDYYGPPDLARGAVAFPKPDPSLPPERIVAEVNPRPLVYGLMQSFIPTSPQIAMVAIRVSDRSADSQLTHTHGLSVVLRKPSAEGNWWTAWLGESAVLGPQAVECGAWNAFAFDPPILIEPGETYVVTVYNKDYVGGGETRLKDGLSGDHRWFLNSGTGGAGDYPNGGITSDLCEDLAFKVYGTAGPLPAE